VNSEEFNSNDNSSLQTAIKELPEPPSKVSIKGYSSQPHFWRKIFLLKLL